VKSIPKKKRKAGVGKICRKRRFKACSEKVKGVMDDESDERVDATDGGSATQRTG